MYVYVSMLEAKVKFSLVILLDMFFMAAFWETGKSFLWFNMLLQ